MQVEDPDEGLQMQTILVDEDTTTGYRPQKMEVELTSRENSRDVDDE